jgi:hypothetical protein
MGSDEKKTNVPLLVGFLIWISHGDFMEKIDVGL